MKTFHISDKYYFWGAIGLALLFTLWVQLPRIQNDQMVEEDFRTLYWVQTYQDAELFPNAPFDLLGVSRYKIGNSTIAIEDSSPGYSLLFQLAAFVMPPILFSKLLVFPLMLTAVIYLFRIGQQLSDSRTAFTLTMMFVVLNLGSSTDISVIGGLHRSFALPFLFALLFYLMNQRYNAAAVILFLSGFIYAPIFPVMAITYGLLLIKWGENGRFRPTIAWKQAVPLIVAVLLVLIALAPLIVTKLTAVSSVSTSVNATSEPLHILEDPIYKTGGRRPLFVIFPVAGRAGIVKEGIDMFYMLLLALFAGFIWISRGRNVQRLPRPFRALFSASLIGFSLSWAAIIFLSNFLLYLPNRHTRFGFFLTLLIFVGINFKEAIKEAAVWLNKNRRTLWRYMVPVSIAILAFVIFLPPVENESPIMRYLLMGMIPVLLLLAILISRREGKVGGENGRYATLLPKISILFNVFLLFISALYLRLYLPSYIEPSDKGASLYAYLETVPKDSLIGGDPCWLNNVSFYAKRTVLFSCERYRFLEDSTEEQTVMDTLNALYAAELDQVYAYCNQYEIDYFIVDKTRFSPQKMTLGEYFYEPYNSQLAPILQRRTNFALNQVQNLSPTFQVDELYVFACNL